MAAFYIDEMRTVQPKGPYYLGGSSFGGLAALEMAQQLNEQGELVAFVALFETGAPGYPEYLPGTTLLKSSVFNLARTFEHHWDNMRLLTLPTGSNYVAVRIGKARHALWRAKRKYKDVARTHGPVMAVRTRFDHVLGRSRLTPYAAAGVVPDDYRKTEGNIRKATATFRVFSKVG